jgi:hypothetical protein
MLQVNRPMGLGELLDGAFRVYRARFSRLVLIAAIFLVPIGLATSLLLGVTLSGFNQLLFTAPGEADVEAMLPGAGAFVAYAGLALLGYLAMAMAFVSLISYIVALLQGEELTVRNSIRRGARRLLPFIGMAVLAGLIIAGLVLAIYLVLAIVFLGFTLFLSFLATSMGDGFNVVTVIMALLAVVFVFAAMALILLPVGLLTARYVAAPALVVAEQYGPKGALDRSWDLTRNNVWRCFGYLALLTILNFVVIGLPISVLQWVVVFAVGTQWYGWLSGLLAGLSYFVNILWYPIMVLAITLIYFDLRVRNESLDLDLRVRRLEESTQPPSQPPTLPA